MLLLAVAPACAAAIAFRSASPPVPQVAPGSAASGRAAALRPSGELSPGRASSSRPKGLRARWCLPEGARDAMALVGLAPQPTRGGAIVAARSGLASERSRSPIPPRPLGKSILMGHPLPGQLPSPKRTSEVPLHPRPRKCSSLPCPQSAKESTTCEQPPPPNGPTESTK